MTANHNGPWLCPLAVSRWTSPCVAPSPSPIFREETSSVTFIEKKRTVPSWQLEVILAGGSAEHQYKRTLDFIHPHVRVHTHTGTRTYEHVLACTDSTPCWLSHLSVALSSLQQAVSDTCNLRNVQVIQHNFTHPQLF